MVKAYASVILLTILLLAGGIFLLSNGSQNEEALMRRVKFYRPADQTKPALEVVGSKSRDLGTLGVKSEKSATFSIKNSGSAILQIYSGTSSCNCTFGQVVNGQNKSPLFGMHERRKFLVELLPGESGTVTVIYKPYLMLNLGLNKRFVTVKTNDPDNPEVDFTIDVIVTE